MTILVGDCRDVLPTLPERSVQTVITSPPYFGLRDYGTGEWDGGDPACDHMPRALAAGTRKASSGLEGGHAAIREGDLGHGARRECGRCGARRVDRQIGLEPSPDEFVAALVQVFREVRRVLRDDGTVWLNLGDSYAAQGGSKEANTYDGKRVAAADWQPSRRPADGLKAKDLIGVPWLVAFALRADGWYLRSDVVWSKPNPMPESVTDRPTRSHEYLFLLSKEPSYFYDQDAIREPLVGGERDDVVTRKRNSGGRTDGYTVASGTVGDAERGRNKRSVWTVATQPFSSERLGLGETEHFAVFPPKLIEPCVLAGSAARACGVCGAPWRRVVEREARAPDERRGNKPIRYQGNTGAHPRPLYGSELQASTLGMVGDVRTVGWEPSCAHDDDTGRSVILDPFAGSGTVGVVCGWHGRDFIGIELSPANAELCKKRIALQGKPGGTMPTKRPKPQPADQMGLL